MPEEKSGNYGQSNLSGKKTKMKCAVFYGPYNVKIEDMPVPEPGPGEILVKVRAALTCGTDLKTYKRGAHPTYIKPPARFGHEFSGDVVEAGTDIAGKFKAGERIVCANSAPCGYCYYCKLNRESLCENLFYLNGSYSQYIIIPARIVQKNLYIMPQYVSYKEAALLEPLACVLHGAEEARIKVGDKVVINGAGPIGLMFVKLAVLKGAFVIVTDLNSERLSCAKNFGARVTIQVNKEIDVVEEVKKITDGKRGVDIAVEATGIPKVWEDTVKMPRKGGTAVLFGGCQSGTSINIDTSLIHYNEITIKGVYHHTPYYVKKSFDLIADGIIDANSFITETVPIEKLVDTFERIDRQEGIKYCIDVS